MTRCAILRWRKSLAYTVAVCTGMSVAILAVLWGNNPISSTSTGAPTRGARGRDGVNEGNPESSAVAAIGLPPAGERGGLLLRAPEDWNAAVVACPWRFGPEESEPGLMLVPDDGGRKMLAFIEDGWLWVAVSANAGGEGEILVRDVGLIRISWPSLQKRASGRCRVEDWQPVTWVHGRVVGWDGIGQLHVEGCRGGGASDADGSFQAMVYNVDCDFAAIVQHEGRRARGEPVFLASSRNETDAVILRAPPSTELLPLSARELDEMSEYNDTIQALPEIEGFDDLLHETKERTASEYFEHLRAGAPEGSAQ